MHSGKGRRLGRGQLIQHLHEVGAGLGHCSRPTPWAPRMRCAKAQGRVVNLGLVGAAG